MMEGRRTRELGWLRRNVGGGDLGRRHGGGDWGVCWRWIIVLLWWLGLEWLLLELLEIVGRILLLLILLKEFSLLLLCLGNGLLALPDSRCLYLLLVDGLLLLLLLDSSGCLVALMKSVLLVKSRINV